MYQFAFADLARWIYADKRSIGKPALYKGIFNLKETGDTYLDMCTFGKGFVFLNGHNLGKYWPIGPQQIIYVPSVWLKKGQNKVVLFDELKSGHTQI